MYYCCVVRDEGQAHGLGSNLNLVPTMNVFSKLDLAFQQIYEMLENISRKVRQLGQKHLLKTAWNLVYSQINTF